MKKIVKRGQVGIIYLILTIAAAFVIAAGIFLFLQFYKSNLTSSKDVIEMNFVAQKIENNLLELRTLSTLINSSTTNISLNITIPERIGDKPYSIFGQDDMLTFRTIGNPSSILQKKIFWENLSIRGYVDSKQGYIELTLYNLSKVLLK
ncbi:MAG: hypothetical protein ACP5IJ_00720 [Candidatus Nanoarchaeia archaeon]